MPISKIPIISNKFKNTIFIYINKSTKVTIFIIYLIYKFKLFT